MTDAQTLNMLLGGKTKKPRAPRKPAIKVGGVYKFWGHTEVTITRKEGRTIYFTNPDGSESWTNNRADLHPVEGA